MKLQTVSQAPTWTNKSHSSEIPPSDPNRVGGRYSTLQHKMTMHKNYFKKLKEIIKQTSTCTNSTPCGLGFEMISPRTQLHTHTDVQLCCTARKADMDCTVCI